MAPRSKVELLPEATRVELEKRLVVGGFSGYDSLAAWLAEAGFEISKSSLHRWGSRFEDRVAGLKIATDQARALVESSPDDEGAMNEALMRLTQEKLFTVLLDLQVDPETIELPKLTRAIADMGRATINQKKWAVEARAKARSELLAEQSKALDKIVSKGGLTDDTIRQIREKLGFA